MKPVFGVLLTVTAAAVLFTGCAQHHANAGGKAEGQALAETPVAKVQPVSKGQEIFLSQCVRCHQGAGNPPGPNAVIMDSQRLNDEASFRSLLRKPTSPMMRTFTADDLSDQQIHELYNYLHGLRTPGASKA
jgi:mono/diheme cytochrome c family protein